MKIILNFALRALYSHTKTPSQEGKLGISDVWSFILNEAEPLHMELHLLSMFSPVFWIQLACILFLYSAGHPSTFENINTSSEGTAQLRKDKTYD